MKSLFCWIVLLALLPTVALAATFTDAAGRHIEVADSPQRIISLIPSATETLFAIGAGSQVVAVTEYANYPQTAAQLPKVGSYAEPGLESILLHRPDLIIATVDGNPRALIEQLDRLKIPVFVIDLSSVEKTLHSIERLGEITGRQQGADELLTRMQNRLTEISEKLHNIKPVTLLSFVMLQPLTVAGHGTFINDIVHRSGGVNVVPEESFGYPTWNEEALLQYNPEAILLPLHPGQNHSDFFERWPQLQAVQNGLVFSIEADWFYRPGPRLVLGVEALAKALHPEIFIDE